MVKTRAVIDFDPVLLGLHFHCSLLQLPRLWPGSPGEAPAPAASPPGLTASSGLWSQRQHGGRARGWHQRSLRACEQVRRPGPHSIRCHWILDTEDNYTHVLSNVGIKDNQQDDLKCFPVTSVQLCHIAGIRQGIIGKLSMRGSLSGVRMKIVQRHLQTDQIFGNTLNMFMKTIQLNAMNAPTLQNQTDNLQYILAYIMASSILHVSSATLGQVINTRLINIQEVSMRKVWQMNKKLGWKSQSAILVIIKIQSQELDIIWKTNHVEGKENRLLSISVKNAIIKHKTKQN